jgi:hypothetical protein
MVASVAADEDTPGTGSGRRSPATRVRRMRRATSSVLVLGLATLLGGCDGGGSGSTPGGDEEARPSETGAAGGSPSPDPGEPERFALGRLSPGRRQASLQIGPSPPMRVPLRGGG